MLSLQAPEAPASAHTDLIGLDVLAPGVVGTIRRLELDRDADRARLGVLGLCLGRRVRVVRQGHGMIVAVFHGRVGLASELACKVLVEPSKSESPAAP